MPIVGDDGDDGGEGVEGSMAQKEQLKGKNMVACEATLLRMMVGSKFIYLLGAKNVEKCVLPKKAARAEEFHALLRCSRLILVRIQNAGRMSLAREPAGLQVRWSGLRHATESYT